MSRKQRVMRKSAANTEGVAQVQTPAAKSPPWAVPARSSSRILWTRDVQERFAAVASAASGGGTEVGALAVVRPNDQGDFVVSRFVVPRQTCTAGSLSFDAASVVAILAGMAAEEGPSADDVSCLRGWIHAHPGRGPSAAFLSSTDEKTVSELLHTAYDPSVPAATWLVSVVTDAAGEHPYGRIDVLTPRASFEVQVAVHCEVPTETQVWARSLVAERVTRWQPPPPAPGTFARQLGPAYAAGDVSPITRWFNDARQADDVVAEDLDTATDRVVHMTQSGLLSAGEAVANLALRFRVSTEEARFLLADEIGVDPDTLAEDESPWL